MELNGNGGRKMNWTWRSGSVLASLLPVEKHQHVAFQPSESTTRGHDLAKVKHPVNQCHRITAIDEHGTTPRDRYIARQGQRCVLTPDNGDGDMNSANQIQWDGRQERMVRALAVVVQLQNCSLKPPSVVKQDHGMSEAA
ncbi:hypothetical protein AAHB37_19530 [Glutamicibacter halophytocola]|uniref:hypothetical protein n=1 Tax=Glutamicibacter halophytocola TaxID=1933880 RepID=UPI0032198F87